MEVDFWWMCRLLMFGLNSNPTYTPDHDDLERTNVAACDIAYLCMLRLPLHSGVFSLVVDRGITELRLEENRWQKTATNISRFACVRFQTTLPLTGRACQCTGSHLVSASAADVRG